MQDSAQIRSLMRNHHKHSTHQNSAMRPIRPRTCRSRGSSYPGRPSGLEYPWFSCVPLNSADHIVQFVHDAAVAQDLVDGSVVNKLDYVISGIERDA